MKWCGILSFTLLGLFSILLLFRSPEDTFIKDKNGVWIRHGNPSFETEKKLAVSEAKALFEKNKLEGKNFSNGPCLSNEIIPDWSVDISHNPRQKIDDDPLNQCKFFREGKTHHFVELDMNGELVRTY